MFLRSYDVMSTHKTQCYTLYRPRYNNGLLRGHVREAPTFSLPLSSLRPCRLTPPAPPSRYPAVHNALRPLLARAKGPPSPPSPQSLSNSYHSLPVSTLPRTPVTRAGRKGNWCLKCVACEARTRYCGNSKSHPCSNPPQKPGSVPARPTLLSFRRCIFPPAI